MEDEAAQKEDNLQGQKDDQSDIADMTEIGAATPEKVIDQEEELREQGLKDLLKAKKQRMLQFEARRTKLLGKKFSPALVKTILSMAFPDIQQSPE